MSWESSWGWRGTPTFKEEPLQPTPIPFWAPQGLVMKVSVKRKGYILIQS